MPRVFINKYHMQNTISKRVIEFLNRVPKKPNTLKEKEKEKEKDKEKEKEKEKKKEYAPTVHMTPTEYDKLVELIGRDNTRRCIDKISHYKGALGKTYKDDYKAILNWTVKEVTGKDQTDWEADKERKQEEERKNGEKKQEQRIKEPIPPGERERLQLIAGNIGKSPEDKT